MKIRTFDNGSLVSESGEAIVRKTIYTMAQFQDKIPRAIRQQIQSEYAAGTAEIVDWMFFVRSMSKVDLNDLPQGFIDGLDDMVANPNINLTQNQVDNFLER